MSSVTPPSFADDGVSLGNRTPRRRGLPPYQVARWVASNGSDTGTSAYTGSFIDDGAGVFSPSRGAPGLGQVDPDFYKQRKNRDKDDRSWNDDIQKAVVGEIQKTLDKMNSIARIDVKKDEYKRKDPREPVTVWMPPRYRSFTIKCDDGRVIYIDDTGVYNSGSEPLLGDDEEEEKPLPNRWIKAPRTVTKSDLHSRSSKSDRRGKHRRKERNLLSVFEPMASILEEYKKDKQSSLVNEAPVPPTGFEMTGGVSGWPSANSTTSTSSSKPAWNHNQPSSLSSVKQKSTSTHHSRSGVRPPPPQSFTTSVPPSKHTSTVHGSSNSKTSGSSRRSQHTVKSRSIRHGIDDNLSTKTYSTYRPPKVEDATETSSENYTVAQEKAWGSQDSRSPVKSAWGGNVQDDTQNPISSRQESNVSWGGSVRASIQNSRNGTRAANDERRATNEPRSGRHSRLSVQNWVDDHVRTVSETDSRQTSNTQGWDRGNGSSGASWDGYERPKTMSEVSVVGSDNGQSRASTHRSRETSTHRSHRSHRSHGSHSSHMRRHNGSEGGWSASEGDWNGSQRANVSGWDGNETGRW